MAVPHLTLEQVGQVSHFVADYIAAQQERYRLNAVPLTEEQRATMNGFFASELLDSVRVVVLDAARVPNPQFYPMLAQMGFPNLPGFSAMPAITFCDVVVSHDPFTDRLLFHELVHVEQYRQLCIPRFTRVCQSGRGRHRRLLSSITARTCSG